ncbi:BolA family protein [Candidatus Mesenet endosymbiont of Phosphuga atrata]|uniref:BolA family protein n=1 Tax=Candidatus Mesenet endosymbiont of Phosphuga atrata TaxID=3066221 RepID=UPI0030D05AD5
MNITQEIEKKINNAINAHYISVIDESDDHAGHHFVSQSATSHIKLIVVSDDFSNMISLARHKLIYKILEEEIKLIHAISLNLYTQDEYRLNK